MAQDFQPNSVPPSCSAAAYCSGATVFDSDSSQTRTFVEGNTNFALVTLASPVFTQATRALAWAFIDDIDQYDGAAGNWTVNISVPGFNTSWFWRETHICRLNSSCVNQESIGSLTGQSIQLTFGDKSMVVSGSAFTPSAGDKIVVVYVMENTGTDSDSVDLFDFRTISSPLSVPVTDITLPADAGTYTITGQDAKLVSEYTLSAEAGVYSIAGQAANLIGPPVEVEGAGRPTLPRRKPYRFFLPDGRVFENEERALYELNQWLKQQGVDESADGEDVEERPSLVLRPPEPEESTPAEPALMLSTQQLRRLQENLVRLPPAIPIDPRLVEALVNKIDEEEAAILLL